MTIRKLRAGRVAGGNANTWVGENGTIFYDEETGQLKISDGNTPGGHYIQLVIGSSTQLGGLKPDSSFGVSPDGTLSLNAGTNSTIGGIKSGNGIIIASDGTVSLDSSGLSFSFGDFYAFTNPGPNDGACLSSVNANQDINIVTNGTGTINIVGEFNVHKTDTTLEDSLNASSIFRISADGQVRMLVPSADSASGAVNIVGGLDGIFQPPLNSGVMLHVTGIAGSPGVASRIYNDSQNAFAAFVARRYNNTAASPTAVLDGEEIMRLSGTAHNGTTIPGTANTRIVYKALGNQTLTNQGGTMEFWTTPQNSTTLTKIASIDNVNGITSTKFTGPLTGNVTGNVSGTAGSVAAANITGTTLASNVTGSSLTSVGTLVNLTVTNTISGSINGNAATVSNGVYTTGSYSDPTWLTISKSKVGLSNVENTALSTWAGSTNLITTGTLTNLVVAGTMRYDIAQNNGTATQSTSKSTPVTCNGRTGQITTSSATLAKGASVTFTVNNSFITAATDVVIVNFQSGATIDSYAVAVTRVQATGSFNITLTNNGTGPLSDTIIINFAVIKVS